MVTDVERFNNGCERDGGGRANAARTVRVPTRLLLVAVLAALSVGVASALFASAAVAGGIDEDTGVYSAAIYDIIPYTWTLVESNTPGAGECGSSG
jgi:hypothetical protein